MRKQKEAKSGQQSALYAVTERFSQHNIGVFILLSATKDTNGNGKIAKPKITKISHFFSIGKHRDSNTNTRTNIKHEKIKNLFSFHLLNNIFNVR